MQQVRLRVRLEQLDRQAPLEQRVLLVLLEHLVLQAVRGTRGTRVRKEQRAIRGTQDTQALLVKQAVKAQLEVRVQLALQV